MAQKQTANTGFKTGRFLRYLRYKHTCWEMTDAFTVIKVLAAVVTSLLFRIRKNRICLSYFFKLFLFCFFDLLSCICMTI